MTADYPIEALAVLLNENCLVSRYWPLIPYKDRLISGLKEQGCQRKSDAEKLPDKALAATLLPETLFGLFRRFLTLYDTAPSKMAEIEKLPLTEREKTAYRELYLLPGVKQVRAELYVHSGFDSLRLIAEASEDEILERIAQTIREQHLSCIVPLPKEVRTHIAAARAFLWEK